ncbi:MAG: hypothetical protein U5R31_15055 [Acidimicrobiia bacterium]|nr:hypothetical protein [Acidimicrobiia bacterium]
MPRPPVHLTTHGPAWSTGRPGGIMSQQTTDAEPVFNPVRAGVLRRPLRPVPGPA